jgi:hypothetical protein
VPGMVSGPPNPTVTLVWGVTNQGIGPVEGRWARVDQLYLSVSGVLDGTERWVRNWTETNAVPAGTAYWRTNAVQLPLRDSGTYFLILQTRVDGDSDASNNALAVPFTFNATASDLAPVAFQAPPLVTGWPNPSVTLIWGVTNRGAGAAVASQFWTDRVYLSGSGWRDGSERRIGDWNETGAVPPGGSYWRTNSLHVPLTDSGSYYLLLETDAEHALDDGDVLNNTLSVPITFAVGEAPPPGTLAGAFLPDASFQVDVYGKSGGYYTLESSADLKDWTRVADFICDGSPTSILDPGAGWSGQRFYRVVPLTQPQALRLEVSALDPGWEANGPELVLEGPLGGGGWIETSTDLQKWWSSAGFYISRSPMRLSSWPASDAPVRFYRAVSN